MLVALAAILSISFTTAQVGIQAGFSSNKSNLKNSESINGFHVGPIYNMSIQGPISLQYGLLYNYLTRSTTIFGVTGTSSQHIVDIPVRVAASFPLESGISAFAFGGPNCSLGGPSTVKSGSTSVNMYDDDDLSRFNLQLGLGAGLQYNNMGLKFSYDFGMLDMHKSDLINYKVNGMKVGLFYNF
ncbi:MAG: porin family protein [Porphyromonadaceae bacterium]|nr:porin family protein [Porphyromonadaceae bacterium]